MGSWFDGLELRERTVAVLEAAAAGVHVDEHQAAKLLADLRAVWVRERRWRNTEPPIAIVHEAGPVISCREYRRSCPGYIVDRRQTCARCGAELVRGRWAMFFDEGDAVGVLGTIVYLPRGHHREKACEADPRGNPCPSTSHSP